MNYMLAYFTVLHLICLVVGVAGWIAVVKIDLDPQITASVPIWFVAAAIFGVCVMLF